MTNKQNENNVMTRVSRGTYKDLQFLKIELDMKSISEVITALVEEHKNGRK